MAFKLAKSVPGYRKVAKGFLITLLIISDISKFKICLTISESKRDANK